MTIVAVLSSAKISTNHRISSPLIRRENRRIPNPNIRKTSSFDGISHVQASPKSQTQRGAGEEETRASNEKPPFISQEDLNYVVKLGGGSVVGAAAIKYGSMVFPEITRPNIAEAVIMISAPVLLAVLLLIIRSRAPTK